MCIRDSYLARPDDDIVWDFIRMAMASAACFAIVPMQDVLNLDSDARMNTPSTLGGNWAWRYRSEALNEWVSSRLRELVDLYGRDVELWEEFKQSKLKAAALEPAPENDRVEGD